MSELLTIEGTVRSTTGKEYARKLRRNGKIPAVLVEKGKSTSIELNPKLLAKVYKHGKKFLLDLEGKTRPVVITDLQIHRIKRHALHIDLAPAE